MTTKQQLLKLINLGGHPAGLVDFTKTSDGFYLGMPAGAAGFDVFLGKPEAPHPGPGLDHSRQTWQNFSELEKLKVEYLAVANNIDLALEFGIAI